MPVVGPRVCHSGEKGKQSLVVSSAGAGTAEYPSKRESRGDGVYMYTHKGGRGSCRLSAFTARPPRLLQKYDTDRYPVLRR